jgi:hypothetical protein
MSTEEAIKTIRDLDSTFDECVKAAGVLADSPTTPIRMLVECLKRRGLPAEIAAMKLYVRTNRPKPKSPSEFIANYEDWLNYLETAKT